MTGEQIWKLFKGDGSGEEISIDFIIDHCNKKNINLDMNKFDQIFFMDNEKSLRNMKNIRKDNSAFIELSTQLKKMNIKSTNNSYKYMFSLDSEKKEANFREAGIDTSYTLDSKILAIAVKKSQQSKYNLVDSIDYATNCMDDCVIILEKTNFYPESGGQMADQGFLQVPNQSIKIDINQVYHIQDYSFHIGKILVDDNNTMEQSNEKIFASNQIKCHVNKAIRYETAMNHTSVHLLNHAIRSHYKNEHSIIQLNSTVKNNGIKFEFSFNQHLTKPTSNDMQSIETICKKLIEKSMPIFINENVDFEKTNMNYFYPVRTLKDVLYPFKVRVVSIGAPWSSFTESKNISEKILSEIDYSAELCCGTHAENTSQLADFSITYFNSNGDSTFEIEACTSSTALQVRKNDQLVNKYFNEMVDLFKLTNKSELDLTKAELNYLFNQIADRSILIENIFKQQPVSYSLKMTVKEESIK